MKNIRKRIRFIAGALLALALIGVALCGVLFLWPMDTAPYLNAPASGELRDRDGRLLQAYLTRDDQWRLPREGNALHPRLRQATVAVEDQRFFAHPGVDPVAVVRAGMQNARSANVVSGASTLTMQLVKMRNAPSRDVIGKIEQALTALRLDWRVDKDTILTAYLNDAPYGGNLVGAEAAAQRYFGKPASELRLSEAALLAGLPKSPTAYDPLRHPDRALARRNHVLDRMREEGMITDAMHTHARADTLGVRYHAFPMEAPHLGARFAVEAGEGSVVTTTINRGIQRMTQDKITRQVNSLGGGITNAAALVVSAQTGEVLAHVGSADFFGAPGGQVDATRAQRSPGSTLKPFTYACAMQQHRLYPREVLLDAPRDYGRYNPDNFDGEFFGPVAAADALAASRNIPALTVLERVGYDGLKDFLQTAGFTTLTRPARYYGMGLTLGNCEVRLDELVAAYAMLASGGALRPLSWESGRHNAPLRVLDPGICQVVYEMLAQPMEEEQWRDDPSLPAGAPRVAWKTGTSTGYHDAWTVVYDSRYVVGVWLGNSDGHANNGLIGAYAALPLAARIFRALPDGARPVPPNFGDVTRRVQVCAQTGLPNTPWCPATREDTFPANAYANRRCDVHQPGSGGDTIYERWPAGADGWDLANVATPANTAPDATLANTRQVRPRITSPVARAEFVLTGTPDGDTIALRAEGGAGSLHWYADGHYLGQADAATPLLWKLTPGTHTIACMDPAGATDSVEFSVRTPTQRPRFDTARAR